MAYENDGPQFSQRLSQRSRFTQSQIKSGRVYRVVAHLIFSLSIPYFFGLYLIFSVVFALSAGNGKKAYAWLIRQYFRWYFTFRGVSEFLAEPLPKPSRPSLFLTTRMDGFAPLYIYQLFKDPLIIPLQSHMYQFRASAFFPNRFLGKCLKHISYPDQELPKALKNIEALLEAGYPVLAHINEEFADPHYKNTLHLHHAAFKKLLKKDIDIYFIHLAGWEVYKETSFVHPMVAFVRCKSKERLLEFVDTTNDIEVGQEVADHFMFRYLQYVQSQTS